MMTSPSFCIEDSTKRSHFDFVWNGLNAGIKDIAALKDLESIENPRSFCLMIPCWSDELLATVLDVFEHFKKYEIYWTNLDLLCTMSSRYSRPLINSANELSLFKGLDLSIGLLRTFPEDDPDNCEILLPGLALNDRLEVLSITWTSYLHDDDHVLPRADIRALYDIIETSTKLEKLSLGGISGLDTVRLGKSLARNRMLKDFMIQFCHFSRDQLSWVLNSLIAHPTLKTLVLQSFHLCSESLKNLLASCSELKHVFLRFHHMEMEPLLEEMKMGSSLETLLIHRLEDHGNDYLLSRLFSVLPFCPHLEILGLLDEFVKVEDMMSLKFLERLPKPIFLVLNPYIMPDIWGTFGNVLGHHPEILVHQDVFDVCEKIKDKPDSYSLVKLLAELNWHGRHLLRQAHRPIPVSLWSFILEGANAKPDVLYQFLKGPAFAARDLFL